MRSAWVHIQEAGFKLFQMPSDISNRLSRCIDCLRIIRRRFERGLRSLERCRFSLDQLKYDYPTEAVPLGRLPSEYLRELYLRWGSDSVSAWCAGQGAGNDRKGTEVHMSFEIRIILSDGL